MKWLNLNSLRKRYAALTVILAIIMLSFSWYSQNKISTIKKNIDINIESRNILIHQNREARDKIWQARDLLFKFQADPQKFSDQEIIAKTISQAISHIDRLSLHPWIKEHNISEIHELIMALRKINSTSKNLIKVRTDRKSVV